MKYFIDFWGYASSSKAEWRGKKLTEVQGFIFQVCSAIAVVAGTFKFVKWCLYS